MERFLDLYRNLDKKYKFLIKVGLIICLFLCIWGAYELLVPISVSPDNNLQVVRTAMIIIPVICLAIGCYLKGKGKLTIEIAAILIMLAGFSLRMGYAFYSGANARQHDVEMYNGSKLNLEGAGHFSYTYIIYSTGKLPDEIKWQFYHPPLWHALVACWMHVYSFFTGVSDIATLYNAGMILSSFIGCLTLYGFKKVIFEVTKNNTIRFISLLLIAFHSQFFIISGWMNNDGLTLMFMVFSLYYAILFYKHSKWIDLLLCGVMIGLGMMSKFNAALICLPIAVLFVKKLISEIKAKNTKKIILKYASFIAVVIPLGFWFIIKNIISHGIFSIGVPGMDPYNNPMGVIGYNVWERFGLFNPFNLNESLYCLLRPNENGYLDFNVWIYTLKCSVLGEYSYWQGDLFVPGLLVFNLWMMILTVFAIIYTYINDKEQDKLWNHIMLIIFIMSVLSYVAFQIMYPVTCTQDFRYMVLILLPGTFFIGKMISLTQQKKTILEKIIFYTSILLILGFVSFSTLTFISIR